MHSRVAKLKKDVKAGTDVMRHLEELDCVDPAAKRSLKNLVVQVNELAPACFSSFWGSMSEVHAFKRRIFRKRIHPCSQFFCGVDA